MAAAAETQRWPRTRPPPLLFSFSLAAQAAELDSEAESPPVTCPLGSDNDCDFPKATV